MKNQLFGENRDLLKFDLVCEIAQGGLVNQFVYVPMLTEDDKQYEAPNICRHEATGGTANDNLLNFLDECIINDKRDIRQLERFFQKCGIKATIYGRDKVFTHEEREAYFNGISKELLIKSLILVDPDKGLEEPNSGAGNLLFAELKKLYEEMDDDSLLMFTQKFPYALYEDYLALRVEQIKDQLAGSQPISLDDLDSILFFLTRNQTLQSRLIQVLQDYTRKYAKTG
jgi:hypothetical protein